AIHILTGSRYTHAAISFDADLREMFSFGRRYTRNPFLGCFRREQLHTGVYGIAPTLPGAVLEIAVSRTEYEKAREFVDVFSRHSKWFGYNYLGLFMAAFGIATRDGRRFVCSEFVYFILSRSGICDGKRRRSLVTPQDLFTLAGDVIYTGDLKRYAAV
ncbi:MAG: hypothetical protein LBC78_03055, partial [Oscillospiraceae bacterium]|nr:hypothetical protein [Oscillospiraceae bacterium]